MAFKIPEVGDPATLCFHTDRQAATVIRVTKDSFTVQRDKALKLSNGEYEFISNPNGVKYVFRKTEFGWSSHGTRIMLGKKQEYYDKHF